MDGQVGNEFGAVEALWSQFENVMAKDTEHGGEDDTKENDGSGEDEADEEADRSKRREEKEMK